jgi:hypothetical protein
MSATNGLYLPILNVSLENSRDEKQTRPEDRLVDSESLPALKRLCVQKIEGEARAGTLGGRKNLIYILYQWKRWGSSADVLAWTDSFVQSRDGALHFLNSCLSTRTSHGLGDYVGEVRRYVSLKTVEELVNLDRLIEQTSKINIEDLDEPQKVTLVAFREALRRRHEGKPDFGPGVWE